MDSKLLFLILATLAVVMVTAKDDSDEINWRLQVSYITLDVKKSFSGLIFEGKTEYVSLLTSTFFFNYQLHVARVFMFSHRSSFYHHHHQHHYHHHHHHRYHRHILFASIKKKKYKQLKHF